MATLTPNDILRTLPRILPELSPADQTRLKNLVAALPPAGRIKVSIALDTAFPGANLDTQNRGMVRLRGHVNEAASDLGMKLELRVTDAKAGGADAREVWFEGDAAIVIENVTEELTQVGDRLLTDTRGTPLGKPLVRWFYSYAHDDGADAKDLYKRLNLALRNNKRYRFEAWHDGEILVGNDWDAKIRAALAASDIGVLAVSHAFFASDYITKTELPTYVDAAGGKHAVPVSLKGFSFKNTDTKGVDARQIWRPEGKAFAERRGAQRDRWVEELVNDIVKLLDAGPGSPTGGPTPERPYGPLNEPATQMLSCDLGDLGERVLRGTRGAPASLSQADLLGASHREAAKAGGVPSVDYILTWLREAGAPALFALLGEYGMGKTITCQRVVREVEARRVNEPTLPHPIYFDLRKLTDLRSRRTPTLVEIIDECIVRGWSPAPPVPHPTAAELIARCKDEPLLFIFDGLDEALVHLTEVDGQSFTREILNLQPGARAGACSTTRLLISCRTHFFRSLQEQKNHFTGQERGRTEAQDYRALVLLPLDEEQVRVYLGHALPGLNADSTLELVRSVHNLSELAERPYTLKLVTEFIPEIERLRAAGKPVYGVTLYRAMVDRWMQRDQGKHHLKPEHKARLMTHLAAWMWKRGQQTIRANELEPWFHAWMDGQPDLRLRYRDVNVDKLEEDLRTATFLVREDSGDEADSRFRFAHTSMQEFFLSRHLFEAVREDRRQDWALPKVSHETLGFFAEHLLELSDPALVDRLGDWCAPYLALASEQWLRYGLLATSKGWPMPSLVGADLHGADLQGWAFTGTEAAPLKLENSTWRDANLRESRWRYVQLEAAHLEGADLRRAEWQTVRAERAILDGARCDGATFRHCEMDGASWAGASGPRACFLFTAAPTELQADAQSAPWAGSAPRPSGYTLLPGEGHTSTVTACAFSPDGTRALSASWDNTLRHWDARSGRALALWQGHTDWVNACAFSPDGTRALSASDDKTLRLWDTRSGKALATWQGHTSGVRACAFSPDGTRALSASYDKTLRLWDARSGKALATWKGHTSPVAACAFSPDGTRALSASADKTLRLWDTNSGKVLGSWQGHTSEVTACTFSPDGARALSASGDNTLRLWDTRSGKALGTWQGHTSEVTACAFSPDGTRALSASGDNTLRLWDTRSGKALATWQGHTGKVLACVFCADGARVLSASYDKTLRLWDTRSGKVLATWPGPTSTVNACAFSPDGTRALSANDDNTLRLWDVRSGKALATWQGHPNGVNACAFSPDGARVLSAGGDKTLRLWDTHSRKALATWQGHTNVVSACAFSLDGTRALSASFDNTLRLWDARSGKALATLPGHTDWVSACAFSPDGTRVLSASWDHTLRLWDARSGKALATLQGHTDWVSACAFSIDGTRALSASWDQTLRLWDTRSGKALGTWQGHTSAVTACAFSPDGTRALSASHDNTLRLWDTRSGKAPATWQGHTGPVTACAFSPDGTRALSASQDNTLRLWDVASGKPLRVHGVFGPDHAVWTPATSTTPDTLIEVSENAWRWLQWQIRDDDGNILDVVPAESFGPLPVASTV